MRIVLNRRASRVPSITTVIPCYRYGRFLPAVTRSALEQPGVDARVIIVDDASPDNSAQIAQGLAARDQRIQVVVHAENAGHIATYNDGLRLVDTDYVALVSADDLVAPGAYRRATALMEHHPRVGLVHGKVVTMDEDGVPGPSGRTGIEVRTVWSGRDWIAFAAREGRNPIISPEAVVRTAALREVGDYSPSLPHSGDLEYWLRVASRWDVGWIRGPVQAYYRVHGGNMHLTDFAGEVANLRHLVAAFDALDQPEVAASLRDAPRLRTLARSSIARRAVRLASESDDRAVGDELLRIATWLTSGDSVPVAPTPLTPRRSR